MKITASKLVVRGDIFRLTVPLNAEHSPEAEGQIGQKNRSEKSVRKTSPKTALKSGMETGMEGGKKTSQEGGKKTSHERDHETGHGRGFEGGDGGMKSGMKGGVKNDGGGKEAGEANRSEKSVRKTSPKTGLKTGLKTSLKTRKLILEVLRQSSNSTIADLMKATKLSRNGVKWHLENLKSSGRIRRVGPDKGGHWEVME